MWVTCRKLIYSNVSVNEQLYLRRENKIVVLEIENRKCLCFIMMCIDYTTIIGTKANWEIFLCYHWSLSNYNIFVLYVKYWYWYDSNMMAPEIDW